MSDNKQQQRVTVNKNKTTQTEYTNFILVKTKLL